MPQITVTTAALTCAGCAHSTIRYRRGVARKWCTRFGVMRDERCIDYRDQARKLRAALGIAKRVFTR